MSNSSLAHDEPTLRFLADIVRDLVHLHGEYRLHRQHKPAGCQCRFCHRFRLKVDAWEFFPARRAA